MANQNNDIISPKKHALAFEPSVLLLNILVSVLGAIIGLELITRVGIAANTSIIGALVAILLAQIPLKFLRNLKRLDRQNLIQTAISGSTFSAANALLLPIGIPYLMGRTDLVFPMLIGASLAIVTDASILYFSFDTKSFPARAAWPPGIATAEALLAAAQKGKKSLILLAGIAGGVIGKYLKIPTDVLGVSWIGNAFALTAFGVGLTVRGYTLKADIDLDILYLPHGVMIGAGLVALIQIIKIIFSGKKQTDPNKDNTDHQFTRTPRQMRKAMGLGYFAYAVIALLIALLGALISNMSPGMLLGWIAFAALSALVSELIVGLAAMHSGWFPAFATALIFLVLGLLFGFPPTALALLVGFTASTGPAFADMAYDLKAGWILRGRGQDHEYELQGRKQQYFTELLSFLVAILVVALVYPFYFEQDLFPPVDRVYVATIQAGVNASVARNLLIWALPGALIQFVGGPSRQLGVLFATGLLITQGTLIAGIVVLTGLLIRFVIVKKYKDQGQNILYILGAGFIAGSALYSFFSSTLKLGKK